MIIGINNMTSMDPPMCFRCRHFHRETDTCDAFPEGIPREIFFGKPDEYSITYYRVDHTKPYPGDHGIQFEPK